MNLSYAHRLHINGKIGQIGAKRAKTRGFEKNAI